MRIVSIITLYLISILSSTAQCVYLAYEGFDSNINTPLHGLQGGSGWTSPWLVQSNDITIPGFQIPNSSGSLSYLDLQNSGNHAEGGNLYLTAGRTINNNNNGPFSSFVDPYGGGLGSEQGDTLWYSALLSKELSDQNEVFIDLHNSGVNWCSNCGNQHIGFGYYGTVSDVGADRRWTLRFNDDYYVSDTAITYGESYLMVLKIIFHPDSTVVDFYVNPTDLGTNGPPAEDVHVSEEVNFNILNNAVYLGPFNGDGRIDEIRFADSYTCVTPDTTTTVNIAPTANFTYNPNNGQIPLTVNLDASLSSDPEGMIASYSWNFGDGTPDQTGIMVSHDYNTLGVIQVTLTVTDDMGQESVYSQTLTLTDLNNSYPCLTSITSLNMASCNQDNGRVRINAGSNNFSLYDEDSNLMTTTNTNEFHNLGVGVYDLYVAGPVCTDSMKLFISIDSTTCAGWEPSFCNMEIGTNMSSIIDYNFNRPLKNRFKHIREPANAFAASCFCWNSNVLDELTFDPDGYPIEIPQNTSVGPTLLRYIISSNGANLQLDSNYIILYDGVGTIGFTGNLTLVSEIPNRIEILVNDEGNFSLEILTSSLGNHVRNIRILKPQHEFDDLINSPFYEVFLDKIAPFSLLRFMDWSQTNFNPINEWNDRKTMDDHTYSGEVGVPYELIIQLANQTNKDLWICVPHLADDNFITQMATLFRDSLTEVQQIYLEYSNEVWNTQFSQFHHNFENRPTNLNYGRAMAEKAKNTFEIWHNVFGDDKCRVKRVLGLQGGYSYINEQILSQLSIEDWDYGSPTHYFGIDHSANGVPILDENSTVQDVMMNATNVWNNFKGFVKIDYNNVHIFGKKVITYEGGQHFVVPDILPYQQAVWDAQNAQEMYDLYDIVLDTIRSWGCELATNYSLAYPNQTIYGSWGIIPHIDLAGPYNITAKKYQVHLDNMPDSLCRSQNTWTGNEDQSWSNICNWSTNKIPDVDTNVIIPSDANNDVKVDIDAFVHSLHIVLPRLLEITTGFTLEIGIE